jgi:hypothetical protein
VNALSSRIDGKSLRRPSVGDIIAKWFIAYSFGYQVMESTTVTLPVAKLYIG